MFSPEHGNNINVGKTEGALTAKNNNNDNNNKHKHKQTHESGAKNLSP